MRTLIKSGGRLQMNFFYHPFQNKQGPASQNVNNIRRRACFVRVVQNSMFFLGDHGYSLGALQDCKNNISHGLTKRLGGMCGKNNSRDWWRTLNRGPVPELI